MFDFDAGKLLVIGVVALIVIGPKELPRVLRQLGQAIGKMRRMAAEFQGQFMDAMKESELDDLRKEAAKFADATKLDFDPARTIRNEMSGIESALNSDNAKPELDEATRASLADDPDGVLLPMNQPIVPVAEEPAPLILPEPVEVASAPELESMILPEPVDEAALPKPVKTGEA